MIAPASAAKYSTARIKRWPIGGEAKSLETPSPGATRGHFSVSF